MAYLAPSEFVTKMVDAGESKIFMSTRDTVIRAYMAGAILALAAAFAITINVQTGVPIVGAALFPVGFCMLYLLGFDLLTGVFVLAPLALIDKRPGVTIGGVDVGGLKRAAAEARLRRAILAPLNRTVVVDLVDEAPAISVAGAVTRKVEGPRQWLSLPAGASAAPVVAALAASYEVADLSIQEPDIEDVIRELYSRAPSA